VVATRNCQAVIASEETAAIANFDAAMVVLRIDDEHASRPDNDVIDVSACARHPAIVQHPQAGNAVELRS
jgi:hypothetical protein